MKIAQFSRTFGGSASAPFAGFFFFPPVLAFSIACLMLLLVSFKKASLEARTLSNGPDAYGQAYFTRFATVGVGKFYDASKTGNTCLVQQN
jgi:hypothetical protein